MEKAELIKEVLANKNLALTVLGKNPQFVNPMGSYLVLKLVKPEKQTAGGIALPDQVVDKNTPVLAEVIKAGPGQRGMMDGSYQPPMCQPGDLVLVVKHSPFEINLAGEVFWVGFEGDCLGVVDMQALSDALRAEEDRMIQAAYANVQKTLEEVKTDVATEAVSPGGIVLAAAGSVGV